MRSVSGAAGAITALLACGSIASGSASAATSSTGHISTVERLFTGDQNDERTIAEPASHRVFVVNTVDSQIDAINTQTHRSRLLPGLPTAGATLNRHTQDLFEYGGFGHGDGQTGLTIIHGVEQVAHDHFGVGDVFNLSHGIVGVLNQPVIKAPETAYHLLRFKGTKQISSTPVCGGLSQAIHSDIAPRVAYDRSNGLLYLACPDWHGRGPEVQIFRGSKLLRTYPDVSGAYFKVDTSLDDVYLVETSGVTLFRGTRRTDSLRFPRSLRQAVSRKSSDVDDRTDRLYVASGQSHTGGVVVVSANHGKLRQDAVFAGGAVAVVVNQQTGVTYVQRFDSSGKVSHLARYQGTKRLSNLNTDARPIAYDPVSATVLATDAAGLRVIAGDRVQQTISVRPNPTVSIAAAAHRIYTLAHGVVTVLRSSSR